MKKKYKLIYKFILLLFLSVNKMSEEQKVEEVA